MNGAGGRIRFVDGSGYEAIEILDQGTPEEKLCIICRGCPFYLDINTGKVEFIPGKFEK